MSAWGERGVCPQCGSSEVRHIIFGFPAGPDSAPPWVAFGGCVIDGRPDDRVCEACEHAWTAEFASADAVPEARRPLSVERPRGPVSHRRLRQRPPFVTAVPPRGDVRILGAAGASVALSLVPSLDDAADPFLVDVELLTPERLVRYLDRPVSQRFIQQLAAAWVQAAADALPEASVPTVEDAEAGLAVLIGHSTPLTVDLEVRIVSALDEDVPDYDGLAFEVPRASLIRAAHGLNGWLG